MNNILDQNDKSLIEEKIDSRDIYDGKLLHVKSDNVKLPSGVVSVREWIKHPGAAAVVPSATFFWCGNIATPFIK